MITITNLGKAYHQQIVLNIEKLEIGRGEIFGLVGNNGAGKTTLLRLMLDLIKADKGQVESGEYVVSKSENWKDYTASFLDDAFLIDFLTPEEYFYFIGGEYGMSKADVDQYLEGYSSFFNNEVLAQNNKYIRDLSRGNKQKTGIIGALLTQPKVLLLDEPFNSLDPSSQIQLKRLLTEYNQRTGATLIISSHDLNHITEISNRIALIEKGIIIKDIQNQGQALSELEKYFSIPSHL